MNASELEALADEVRAALILAGYAIYDINAEPGSPEDLGGGVAVLATECEMGSRPVGVLVNWEVHTDLARRRNEAEDADRFGDRAVALHDVIYRAQNRALTTVLRASGFKTVPDPNGARPVVVGKR